MQIGRVQEWRKNVLAGIKESWKQILFGNPDYNCRDAYTKALNYVCKIFSDNGVTENFDEFVRPPGQKIMRVFRETEPEAIRVIIIGQDPYPSPKDADGLAFASDISFNLPKSLVSIFECLERNGFAMNYKTARLQKWVDQGVLLLNRYLTRCPTIKKTPYGPRAEKDYNTDLHKEWSAFTEFVIRSILEQNEKRKSPYVAVVMWGEKAKELPFDQKQFPGAEFMTWGHPSPINTVNSDKNNPRSFFMCDHFTRINVSLEERGITPIDWSTSTDTQAMKVCLEKQAQMRLQAKEQIKEQPLISSESKRALFDVLDDDDGDDGGSNEQLLPPPLPAPSTQNLSKIVVFTDGACRGNGKLTAKGSFAVYFPDTFDSITNLIKGKRTAKLLHSNFVLNQELAGEPPRTRPKFTIKPGTIQVSPTNNRAEAIAIINALMIMNDNYDLSLKPRIIIYTDSEYCKKWCTDYIWKWEQRDEIDKKSNPDLTRIFLIILRYYKEIYQELYTQRVEVIHIPGHQKDDSEISKGNRHADGLCNATLDS